MLRAWVPSALTWSGALLILLFPISARAIVCVTDPPGCRICQKAQCNTTLGRWVCVASTGSCNDGNPCTYSDHCSGGLCVGTAYSCPGPCQSCDGTSACTINTGIACNDGNACTYNDSCNASGQCVGTTISCPGPCQSCNGTSACAANVGTACNDGNACTFNDRCTGSGTCAGTPYLCSTNQCQSSATCSGDGTCAYASKPDGTACNNGLSCNVAATCQAGSCNAAAGSLCGGPVIVYAYDRIGNITSQRACATCASLGANCGNPSDNCGNTLSCGICPATQTCSGYVCH